MWFFFKQPQRNSFQPRVLQFGSARMPCTFQLDGEPHPIHQENLDQILHRLDHLWATASLIICRQIANYKRPLPIKAPLYSIEITIPNRPISTEVSWHITAVIHDDYGGWFDCRFEGWEANEQESQAYF